MKLKKGLKIALSPLLKEYYQWVYWSNIVKSMESSKADARVQTSKKSGIAFSFDDSFRVNHWHKYVKELFGFYDIKVTFNINAYHHFEGNREHTQDEVDKLIELQAMGHEIAHHGFNHRRSTDYSSGAGLQRWIKEDILPLFSWMEKQSHSITNEKFKKPVSYAFPFFAYREENIKELVPNYFKIVRGHHLNNYLIPFDFTGLAPSICIDQNLLKSPKYIKKVIKVAKSAGKNIIFTCHSVLPEEADWNKYGWGNESIKASLWRISPETIRFIIEEAKNNDMSFYTTSEIADVASFIDNNLERSIREVLQNPMTRWISIEELNKIKELDLSSKNISNLDGIQYFTNLETLNLSNNNISDLRLLKKLPKLKKLDVRNNLVKKDQTLIC